MDLSLVNTSSVSHFLGIRVGLMCRRGDGYLEVVSVRRCVCMMSLRKIYSDLLALSCRTGDNLCLDIFESLLSSELIIRRFQSV